MPEDTSARDCCGVWNGEAKVCKIVRLEDAQLGAHSAASPKGGSPRVRELGRTYGWGEGVLG